MGAYAVPIDLGDASGSRFRQLEALVDTGATYTVVSASVLAELGIEPQHRHPFELADGRVVEYDLAEARVRVDGQETATWVVFGDEGARPLLGVYSLEGLCLAVDPVRRRLMPVPGLLKVSKDEVIEVQGPEDIPEFANEDAEHAFWSTHCIGERFVERVGLLPPEKRPARILKKTTDTSPSKKRRNIPL